MIKITVRKQEKTTSTTDRIFNEASLYPLNYFVIALISLIFIIYVNYLHHRLLFELLICAILFLILLHFHLTPPLLICPLFSTSLDRQTLLPSPTPSSCTCCHTQHLIYSPAPPTHPPNPISPPPGYCTKFSYLMSLLDLISKITSSPSSTFPCITSS